MRTWTRATESISYGLAIERARPRASERTSERIGRIGERHHIIRLTCCVVNSCDTSLKKLSTVILVLRYSSLIIIHPLPETIPRSRRGIYFPTPPLSGRHRQRVRSPEQPVPTIKRHRQGSFIYGVESGYVILTFSWNNIRSLVKERRVASATVER